MQSTANPRGTIFVLAHESSVLDASASTLRDAGFVVETASSEAQAVEYLRDGRPSAMLLDIERDGIDKFEFCKHFRRLLRNEHVPLLVYASQEDPRAAERAFAGGATDFITRPIAWPLLPLKVRYALRTAELAASAIRIQQQLERAQRMARLGNWSLRPDGRSIAVSRTLVDLLDLRGLGHHDVDPRQLLDRIHPEDRDRIADARQEAMAKGTPYRHIYRVFASADNIRTLSEVARPAIDHQGQVVSIEGITQDISEKIDAEQRISYLSQREPMTGLPNNAYFLELAGQALTRADSAGVPCALLHVEIDQYNTVVNAFRDGDSTIVLRATAQRIAEAIRASDVASHTPDTLTSELGHAATSVFSVLLVNCGDVDAVTRVAERIKESIAEPLRVEGADLLLTASIGIAIHPRDGTDAEALSLASRQAHLAARLQGRGTTRLHSADMRQTARARLSREAELRHGIFNGQLRLVYQPKVDANSGRIVGAEALVRWMHADGLVGPDQFIPLAEETGLVVPLTEWVLETTCADMAHRRTRGLIDVPVSVNFASTSFQTSGDLRQLRSVISRHGLTPACLVLELTETLLLADTELAIRRVKELRADGFRLSLDDFGTGYSALSHFKHFHVDELKIDRTFISEVTRAGRDAGIVCAITALGREFGLDVCAEGVETREQAEFLTAIGCHLHQGWLYAKPMQGMDFDALLVKAAKGLVPWHPKHTGVEDLPSVFIGDIAHSMLMPTMPMPTKPMQAMPALPMPTLPLAG